MSVQLAIAQIMIGCGVNNIFLEMITTRDSGSGGLITLAQFLFVSCEGFLSNFSLSSGLFKRKVPLWIHFSLTFVFFAVSVVNNMALNYGISMPLHMVFRSSSLAASLFIGWAIFRKQYESNQIFGVAFVTVGIIITTLADAVARGGCCDFWKESPSVPQDVDDVNFSIWLTGLAMLFFALITSALLGHCQDYVNRRYGKCVDEMKFYSHVLALPFFYVLQGDNISLHVEKWQTTETLHQTVPADVASQIPEFLASIPILWYLLFFNVATQLICITGVYRLTALSSTLTCTMTLTVRKFFSIIFSVVYFQNPFSLAHWIGTILVFTGALMYSGVILPSSKEKKD